MKKFKVNDRVIIISPPEEFKECRGYKGRIIPIGGIDVSVDDVAVKLDNGKMIVIREHQIKLCE